MLCRYLNHIGSDSRDSPTRFEQILLHFHWHCHYSIHDHLYSGSPPTEPSYPSIEEEFARSESIRFLLIAPSPSSRTPLSTCAATHWLDRLLSFAVAFVSHDEIDSARIETSLDPRSAARRQSNEFKSVRRRPDDDFRWLESRSARKRNQHLRCDFGWFSSGLGKVASDETSVLSNPESRWWGSSASPSSFSLLLVLRRVVRPSAWDLLQISLSMFDDPTASD